MASWPNKPFIFQINTWVWLTALSERYDRPITLDNIPDDVFRELDALNVDAIWLMGVWQRNPAGRESALNYKHEYRPVLSDLTDEDVVGSAYAIGAYTVDERFGGRAALAKVRERLAGLGLKLILDYVPNHVATDHHWINEKPHYLIRGTASNLEEAPDLFFRTKNDKGQEMIFAHGRDPYFPGWIDTAQVNAFSLEYRRAAVDVLCDIASQCDGIRCDMAMLMTNDVFERTWGYFLSDGAPDTEFWEDIIPAVKEDHPDCLFMAEVYWDMEYEMLQQGFDYTYDKRLYDRIQDGFVHLIREHLQAASRYQERQVRFIENHDEQRAAASLGIERQRPGAVLIATLPGAVLLHDGQFTGRTIKIPMQINRRPHEPENWALDGFYRKLLAETRHPVYQLGSWRLFEVYESYPGNYTNLHLLAYGWAHGTDFRLIVTNPTHRWSQGFVRMYGWEQIRGHDWRLVDVLSGLDTHGHGDQIADEGLYVELEAYQSHVFRFERK
ncbi:MAG: alpha-amylase [Anaerolineaceae bacterium]|nr:MAG: alpha-amylase [Anaerolineaceae bacterium]